MLQILTWTRAFWPTFLLGPILFHVLFIPFIHIFLLSVLGLVPLCLYFLVLLVDFGFLHSWPKNPWSIFLGSSFLFSVLGLKNKRKGVYDPYLLNLSKFREGLTIFFLFFCWFSSFFFLSHFLAPFSFPLASPIFSQDLNYLSLSLSLSLSLTHTHTHIHKALSTSMV